MTRASIVIPSRGGAHRLPVLLDSLARQTEQDFEVVVVLDGDIDDSEAVLRARTDLPVSSIVFPENRGRSAALNAGFAAATGEILVRCDDDLELEPDFVEHHARLHRDVDHGIITMCREVYTRETAYSKFFGSPSDERIRVTAFRTSPDQTWRWWSGCVSVTRNVYDRVGPYDLAYRTYGWEDVDWGYRLHRLGIPIVIPAGFTTRHHGPVTSVTERAQRAFHSGAARLKFEQLHGDEALAVPLTPGDDRRNAWTRLVEISSSLVTERTVLAAGSLIDRGIGHVGPRLAEKAVALLVESASEAGRRHPERITSIF